MRMCIGSNHQLLYSIQLASITLLPYDLKTFQLCNDNHCIYSLVLGISEHFCNDNHCIYSLVLGISEHFCNGFL